MNGDPAEGRWHEKTILKDGMYSNYADTLMLGTTEDNARDTSYYNFLTKHKDDIDAFYDEHKHLVIPCDHQKGKLCHRIRSYHRFPAWHKYMEERGFL